MNLELSTPPVEPASTTSRSEPPPAMVEPDTDNRLIGWLRGFARLQVPAQTLAFAAQRFAQVDDVHGNALADLAVTGRASVAAYDLSPPTAEAVLAKAAAEGFNPGPWAVEKALSRARRIREWLELSGPERAARPKPSWIAVSGEDDPPWRPVNAHVTRFPQHDLDLTVDGRALRIRYVQTGPLRGYKVVVLLHGHSSRLEEYEALVEQLHAIRRPNGLRKYTVVVLDLPGNGYSSFIEPADITSGSPNAVQFVARAVRSFIETLFARDGTSPDVACIGGGSLGGNLSLLFGEHRPSWLQAIAPWSPAAMWGWNAFSELAKGTLDGRAAEPETPDRRHDLMKRTFEGENGVNQSEQWYSASWAGKESALIESRLDRQEIYSPTFRRWHWRIAREQLDQLHGDTQLRTISCPVLILAGADDDHAFTHIYGRVRDAINGPLASVPGTGHLLTGVGHSIHNERPAFLAGAIDRFLDQHTTRTPMATDIKLINETDTILVEGNYLKLSGPYENALEIDGQGARQRNGGRSPGANRRALAHVGGDQLIINYAGEYLGGVTVNGGEGPILVQAIDQIRLVAPRVTLPQSSRLYIEYMKNTGIVGRPGVIREPATMDVLGELLALRKEVNDLKARLGVP